MTVSQAEGRLVPRCRLSGQRSRRPQARASEGSLSLKMASKIDTVTQGRRLESYRDLSPGFFLRIDHLTVVDDQRVSGRPVTIVPADTFGERKVGVGEEELWRAGQRDTYLFVNRDVSTIAKFGVRC